MKTCSTTSSMNLGSRRINGVPRRRTLPQYAKQVWTPSVLSFCLLLSTTAHAVNYIAYAGYFSSGNTTDITDELSVGQSYNFAATRRYESWYGNPSSEKAAWYIDGVKLQESTQYSGGPYSSATFDTVVSATWTATIGTHTLLFVEDPDNLVSESLETDNQVSRTFTVTATTPEIDIQGNSVSIADGAGTPNQTDHTDFGSVPVGGTITRTFTITNSGVNALHLASDYWGGKVDVSGANATDFSTLEYGETRISIPPFSRVGPGEATTFQVTFAPSGIGLRTAALSIANDDGNENPYNFSIQGMGTAANASPTNIILSSTNISEVLPAGTIVGHFITQDQDAGDTFVYVLTNGTGSADNGSFTISGSNLLTVAVFNYEVKSNYSIRVQSTDQGSLFTQNVFAINVIDVNEPPPSFSEAPSLSGSNMVIHWSSITNKKYTVHFSTNLISGFSVLQSNIPGTSAVNSYTDTLPVAMQKYWKVTTDP